jgi:rhodanese-related sulfurtransferase
MFKQMLEAGRFAAVLDVRSNLEFLQGHIAGATFMDSLATGQRASPRALTGCESCTMAVYCNSGARAAAAIQVLRAAGFTGTLYNALGVSQWVAAGFPLVQTPSQVPPCTTQPGNCRSGTTPTGPAPTGSTGGSTVTAGGVRDPWAPRWAIPAAPKTTPTAPVAPPSPAMPPSAPKTTTNNNNNWNTGWRPLPAPSAPTNLVPPPRAPVASPPTTTTTVAQPAPTTANAPVRPPRQPVPAGTPTNMVPPTGSNRAPVMPVPRPPTGPATNVVANNTTRPMIVTPTFGNWTWFEDMQSSARGGGTTTSVRIVVGLVLAVVGAAVMA